MSIFQWEHWNFEKRRMRQWNEDCHQILSALKGDASSLDLWHILKRPISLYRLHELLDDMEAFGYIESRHQPGGQSRGWRDRRIVSATDKGRVFLKELETAKEKPATS